MMEILILLLIVTTKNKLNYVHLLSMQRGKSDHYNQEMCEANMSYTQA